MEISKEAQAHYLVMNKTRRTLLRVHDIDYKNGLIEVCIPGWNLSQTVKFDLAIVPETIKDNLLPACYLFGYVNTGAEVPEQLILHSVESTIHYLHEAEQILEDLL